ncbi:MULTISPECIES: PDR/VanB family oxidoreductase [unclassified Nocardioides]|uniref:PDR/VanB family oxidoreductase n=1 Tax=unclassified Nocardioides TaxID=2615069 RepID=UPI0006FE24FD|nr:MULTISPECIES: PDR/VanB family oxidoreductase [unclassified Nocardioides]KRA37655.1 oxidoreductase [Nocardioides sp. Root614]KRA91615.1 oxidoreductase [Nocardioides sp. Root682]
MTATAPSLKLRALATGARAYSAVFAASAAAPYLSRPTPVRRTGFDLELTVAAISTEVEDVVSFELRSPDGSDLPAWVPGAHLDVLLPSGAQRQYSLCGDPRDLACYRIAVRRIEGGGGGSLAMHREVAEGDPITVRGPRNAFTFIDVESYLFVAGGIGITPILPMVREAARRGARWRMVYVGRSLATMPFVEELQALDGGELELRPDDQFGQPDPWELLGRAEPGAAIYVCGPPQLIDAARALQPTLNPTGSLHSERFSAPPVVGGHTFDVHLARTGMTVHVAADESALAAIRREVPGVRYSCQQGFCGSCKHAVVEGAVEHRDQKLRPAERADSMLICVSRAAGDHLTLDL